MFNIDTLADGQDDVVVLTSGLELTNEVNFKGGEVIIRIDVHLRSPIVNYAVLSNIFGVAVLLSITVDIDLRILTVWDFDVSIFTDPSCLLA